MQLPHSGTPRRPQARRLQVRSNWLHARSLTQSGEHWRLPSSRCARRAHQAMPYMQAPPVCFTLFDPVGPIPHVFLFLSAFSATTFGGTFMFALLMTIDVFSTPPRTAYGK